MCSFLEDAFVDLSTFITSCIPISAVDMLQHLHEPGILCLLLCSLGDEGLLSGLG
jgi:hypothetical protein